MPARFVFLLISALPSQAGVLLNKRKINKKYCVRCALLQLRYRNRNFFTRINWIKMIFHIWLLLALERKINQNVSGFLYFCAFPFLGVWCPFFWNRKNLRKISPQILSLQHVLWTSFVFWKLVVLMQFAGARLEGIGLWLNVSLFVWSKVFFSVPQNLQDLSSSMCLLDSWEVLRLPW